MSARRLSKQPITAEALPSHPTAANNHNKDHVDVASLAQQLLVIEESTEWDAVKGSWSYKQKGWVSHVSGLIDSTISGDGINVLKSLANDLRGALKPKARDKVTAAAAAAWPASARRRDERGRVGAGD